MVSCLPALDTAGAVQVNVVVPPRQDASHGKKENPADHFAKRLATAALAVAEPTIRAQERERLARWRKSRDDRSLTSQNGRASEMGRHG